MLWITLWAGCSLALTGAYLFFMKRRRAKIEAGALPDPELPLEDALSEQVRREVRHHLLYRGDQRERAIQQRLSRLHGKKAFEARTLRLIRLAIEKHDTLGEKK